ncbi:MAG TPA: hypothetical protein DCG24_06525 [Bacteroidetes bacterium]|nr:hypothetical protein [Bacteroidota bacterium]HAE35852.1 hypothetical protein [Bacteroidota bacterium]
MFKKMLLVLLGSVFLIVTQVQAQRCGIDAYTQYKISQDPKYAVRLTEAEHAIQEWLDANHIDTRSGGDTYTIPVVVHVIWKTATQNISDAQVMSQIDILNEDFQRMNADTVNTPAGFKPVAGSLPVQFCLAQRDPDDEPTNGIERRETTVTTFGLDDQMKFYASGGLDQWDPTRYFNIWVCNISGGILGYGEFPTGTVSDTYGVVIDYQYFGDQGTATPPYDLGRTATHELGHCFNLRHIWGDDGSSCGGSDLVDDTPNQGSENYGCPGYPKYDACSPSGDGVMFMNYMDYTDDDCMNMFTEGQADRMWSAIESFYPELLTSDACEPFILLALDAGVTDISQPVGQDCDGSVTPVVTIRNWGANVLNSVTINYSIDGGSPNTYNWSGSLASLATANVTLPAVTAGDGIHVMEIYTSEPNGSTDMNTMNDSGETTFSVFNTGVSVPVEEGFEAAAFPPAGWSVNNSGAAYGWERTLEASSLGDASVWVNNYDYNDPGAEDDLLSIPVDLAGMSGPLVTFDVAYASFKQGVVERTDALEVLVVTSCDGIATSVYYKEGDDLDTRTPTAFAFTPSSSQWRTDSIDLSSFIGEDYVSVVFRSINGYGNNLYLDNINISDGLANAIGDELRNAASVYPNPANTELVIEWKGTAATGTIQLTDLAGRTIWAGQVIGSNNEIIRISTAQLPAGIYTLLYVAEGGSVMSEQISVQH